MRRVDLLKLLLVLLVAVPFAWANPFEYTWQELAPGVWAGIRQDPFELPQEGNSLFVVTEEGVVVFDAGGSPKMGESIVAKVKSVTNKPITHIIISHWHADHMRGLQAITAAFPAAHILTHPYSRDFIVSTQDKWLKRRESMVPSIRKNVPKALESNKDMAGRPLIPAEKAWIEKALTITDELDSENRRTAYVIPDTTFEDHMTLYLGKREIQILHPGKAHTAGDLVLWLPQEKIVATGDVVTTPVPLMPSPYTSTYVSVLDKIKALGFTTLVPGHGLVLHDATYLDLMADTIKSASTQMKSLVAQGLSEEDAVPKVDFSSVEDRYTHGDGFLKNRFQDYVSIGLPTAAYAVEKGGSPKEVF